MESTERPVIAYLGPQASYTHQAALSTFQSQQVTLQPCITIADVFTSVQNGTAHRGVVPFENSSNGSVVFTLDLIADIHGAHPSIRVCGEAYVSVKHCLLGHLPDSPTSPEQPADVKIDPSFKPVARPVCDVSGVKVLYSHPQAWGQCKAFLSSYFKGVERRDVSSTSKAAEIVSADKSGESAALSSSVAAGVFGCDVLAEGVNDRVGNETRFLVIRRDDDGDGGGSEIVEVESGSGEESVRGGSGKVEDERDFKTLITFTVDHANPGALAECLAAFARYGLNLTSINTRPSGVENWNYIFFVELKSRKGRSKNGDGPVDKALKNLEGVCRALKWQGSWENRLDG